jgi:peroxiredoxin
MLQINETLPESLKIQALHNNQIKDLDISNDFKDKWKILVFYPADFTFVCPTELQDYARHHSRFQQEGAEVFSISTDTVFAHKAWHDSSPAISQINFPMVADPTLYLCNLFGTLIEEEGLSLRGTFLISPDNKLKAFEMHDNDIGRSASEMLRKLQAAKHTLAHGEVCPANWRPGSQTIKPGLDLVGKI